MSTLLFRYIARSESPLAPGRRKIEAGRSLGSVLQGYMPLIKEVYNTLQAFLVNGMLVSIEDCEAQGFRSANFFQLPFAHPNSQAQMLTSSTTNPFSIALFLSFDRPPEAILLRCVGNAPGAYLWERSPPSYYAGTSVVSVPQILRHLVRKGF